MKGKWQTDAVRHNNNTSHDGAVMRTITCVYPRQPQQYDSFCRFEGDYFLYDLFPLAQASYHQPKDSTSKDYLQPCFLSRFSKSPTCIVTQGEAMNNSDSSWRCDEYKLINSREECVKKHNTLCAISNNPCDLPSVGGDVFTSQHSLNPLRFRAMIKQTNGS